jgi:hypothetical protein
VILVKLVKFQDGRYGVRKWFFGYRYLDIRYYNLLLDTYWWPIDGRHINNCKGELQEALDGLKRLRETKKVDVGVECYDDGRVFQFKGPS